MYTLFGAMGQTGVLGSSPVWAVLELLRCLMRYGASLYTLVAWQARLRPQQTALVAGGTAIGYLELQQSSDHLAAALAQRDPAIKTVGLLGRNSIAYVEALLACGRLGLEVVLLNTMQSNEQIRDLLKNKPLDLLLCDPEFVPKLAGLGVPLLQTDRLNSKNSHLDPVSSILPRLGKITILTSGTTGAAKPVRRKITLAEALGTALGLLEGFKPKTGEAVLLTLPLLHGHGLATLGVCLGLGAPLYFFPKAKTEDLIHCIEAQKIRVLVLVPTVLYRLLEASPNSLPSLRAILCGSAPLGAGLAQRTLEHFGPVLFNLYGSSEAGLISLATPQDLAIAPSTVGRALPKSNLRLISKDASHPHPIAVIWARGINTGDLGYLKNGLLFLCGRADELLICGGENVYPQAIEEAVCQQLGYVLECAATGIPDPEYGQAIHLFLVLKTECPLEAIAQDLEALFPRTLRPRKITLLKGLPRNLAGKLQRFRLTQAADTTLMSPEPEITGPVP